MFRVKCQIALLFLMALFEWFQLGISNTYNNNSEAVLKSDDCECLVRKLMNLDSLFEPGHWSLWLVFMLSSPDVTLSRFCFLVPCHSQRMLHKLMMAFGVHGVKSLYLSSCYRTIHHGNQTPVKTASATMILSSANPLAAKIPSVTFRG